MRRSNAYVGLKPAHRKTLQGADFQPCELYVLDEGAAWQFDFPAQGRGVVYRINHQPAEGKTVVLKLQKIEPWDGLDEVGNLVGPGTYPAAQPGQPLAACLCRRRRMYRRPGDKLDAPGVRQGDLRLVIAELGGELKAVLFRPVSDTKAPYLFDAFEGAGRASAVRMDEVRLAPEVKAALTRAGEGYIVEAAIPWALPSAEEPQSQGVTP